MKSRLSLAAWLLCGLAAAATAQVPEAKKISYGPEPTSFGELLIPEGAKSPVPVVVLLHGGCWRSDRGSNATFRPMAQLLAQSGIATWNIEWRLVGREGGGWPGTFLDLGRAIDLLPDLAREYPLDLQRIYLAGHSSGGHFAAWLEIRKQLPKNSEIRGQPEVDFAGVVLSDAFINPLVMASTGVDGSLYCDEPLIERYLGGTPAGQPERLHEISPLEWLPWGVRQEYVVSSRRYPVIPRRPLADDRTTMDMPDYPALARAAGDSVNVEIVDNAAHRDFMTAGTPAYEAFSRAILRVVAAPVKR